MPPLPDWDRAIFDLRKLADYCLDPGHPRGRHKARVFRSALGLDKGDAGWLRETLLAALESQEVAFDGEDRLGRRWRVDIPVARQGRPAVVRTIWIVRAGEEVPRFATCWVL